MALETATPARTFVEDVLTAAASAADNAGGWRERNLEIDGTRMRLRFAGDSLVGALLPALAHLSVGADEASADEVTITVWDSESTGTPFPEVPWSLGDIDDFGRVRSLTGDGITVFHIPYYDGITLYDHTRREGVYWLRTLETMPWWERGSPLRTAFNLALAEKRRRLVHSAAVGSDAGVVLLGGRSGSGKSTTALSCLDAGLGYAGDDFVLVSLDPEPTAHSLYTSAKVDFQRLTQLPAFAGSVDPAASAGDKAVLELGESHRDLLVRSAPVRAVVLPRVRGEGETELRPISRSEAVRILGPSTVLQQPHRSAELLRLVDALLTEVPGYRLELGEETRDAVPLLKSLLGEP